VKELLGTEQRQRMWRGESIRLMMLGTHYRKSIDFRMEGLEASKKKLDRWYRALQSSKLPSETAPSGEFLAAVCDDLNTPLAIAVLDSMCGKILAGKKIDSDCVGKFVAGAGMLGLLRYKFSEWFQGVSSETESSENEEIGALVHERSLAKRGGDFEAADTIRQKLIDRGVIVEDKAGGKTVWRWQT
jgi:cysteinyl-tRNA synthetase